MKKKVEAPRKFLAAIEIDWVDQYVNKDSRDWLRNISATLRSLSNIHNLPIKHIKIKGSNHYSIGYSPKAIAILKAQMEKHPGNFDNGKMLKWE